MRRLGTQEKKHFLGKISFKGKAVHWIKVAATAAVADAFKLIRFLSCFEHFDLLRVV